MVQTPDTDKNGVLSECHAMLDGDLQVLECRKVAEGCRLQRSDMVVIQEPASSEDLRHSCQHALTAAILTGLSGEEGFRMYQRRCIGADWSSDLCMQKKRIKHSHAYINHKIHISTMFSRDWNSVTGILVIPML